MQRFDFRKYRPSPSVAGHRRRWPDRQLERAPSWCSVDLRDGNQALPRPMNIAQKQRMFDQLVKIGFKEIEVGFPAASQPDFDFVRQLIESGAIPDDVTIQVLTQARREIIERTFEALRGVRRAVVHVYNSTSVAQRRDVFRTDRKGVLDIATQGAGWVQQLAAAQPETAWTFQYSPESFTQTELDFAVEVCSAVCAIWRPDQGQPVIINLPSTVEVDLPNVFADKVEWFCDHFPYRPQVTISVHTHNDRGCAVAAAELAVLGGADRVEGTLLGNGERTGNMDIVTMAMNLYSQGIDPALDFSDMAGLIETVEACTRIETHVRHPYVGELVYTAFSGSHQDAIRKGLAARRPGAAWDVPYLPIDPADIGRSYEAVVRVNSQSGKGGVAFALAQHYGLELPRPLQVEFSAVVQAVSEATDDEVSSLEIHNLFHAHYVNRAEPWRLRDYRVAAADHSVEVEAELDRNGQTVVVKGSGQGTLAALINGYAEVAATALVIVDYHEHALGEGTDAQAVGYLAVEIDGQPHWGVGIAEDSMRAAFNALLSAVNRGASVAQTAVA